MKREDYIKEIQEFNRDKDVMKLERMFNNSSVLSIVGVERKEIRHSRFLEWLFNQQEINTSDLSSPIMHLLDVIIRRDESQNPDKRLVESNLSDGIVSRSMIIKDLVAIREQKTDGVTMKTRVPDKKTRQNVDKEMTGSIDILIKVTADMVIDGKRQSDKKIAICIENKAFTEEHDLQTWKYYAYLTGSVEEFNKWIKDTYKTNENEYPSLNINPKTSNEKYDYLIFVYLKPSANAEMEDVKSIKADCKCPHYVHINYQDVVDEILTPILNNEETPEAFLRHINQYVASLGLQIKKENSSTIEAMAYERAVVDLKDSIWSKHSFLIEAAFKDKNEKSVLSQFRIAHNDFLAKLSSVIEMTTIDKDQWLKTRYYRKRLSGKENYFIVDNNGKKEIYNQSELAFEFAKRWILIDNNHSIDHLNNEFEKIKKINAEYKLFSSNQSYKDKEKKKTNLYEKISDNEDIYFLKNCWSPSSNYFPTLIEFIKSNKEKLNFVIEGLE